MKLSLKPDIEQFIQSQIKAGHFASASEVVEAAVAGLMAGREQHLPDDELQELRAEIAIGLEQSRRGESRDWDISELRAEGQRLLDEAKKRAG